MRRDERMSFRRGATASKVLMRARLSTFSAALTLAEHGPRTSSAVVVVAMKVGMEKSERRSAAGR